MVSAIRSSTTIDKVSVYLCEESRDLDKRPSKQPDAILSQVPDWRYVSGIETGCLLVFWWHSESPA